MLQWWDERGILSPRFDGNGERSYSSGELVLARIVTALRKKGMPLQQVTMLMARYHIRHRVIENGQRPRYVVADGKDLWLLASRVNVVEVATAMNRSVIVARIGETS